MHLLVLCDLCFSYHGNFISSGDCDFIATIHSMNVKARIVIKFLTLSIVYLHVGRNWIRFFVEHNLHFYLDDIFVVDCTTVNTRGLCETHLM